MDKRGGGRDGNRCPSCKDVQRVVGKKVGISLGRFQGWGRDRYQDQGSLRLGTGRRRGKVGV